jgi:predicted acyltransferase
MSRDREHLASLDVVRGLSVAAMILVNNPGDWNTVFPSLMHADWNGLASGALALSIYMVDVRGWRTWARPFLALGVNPLAIYFGSELVGHLIERGPKSAIYWGVFAPLFGAGEWVSLVFALAYVGVWSAIAVALDRRGIRIRV